jgi:hypothetical protein
MEVSSQLHALAALPPGKELPVPNRLGIPQSRSWRYGEIQMIVPSGTRATSPSVV